MKAARSASNNPKGQYLLEFLVALGVFVLIVGALSTLMLDATQMVKRSAVDSRAVASLQEGMSASLSMKRQGWSVLPIGTFGLSSASGTWKTTPTPDTANGVTREIDIAYAQRDASGNIVASGTHDLLTKSIDVIVKRANTASILSQQRMYLTLYNGTQVTETTVSDFQAGTFQNTETSTSGDGAVTLSSGTATTGFPFVINAFANDLDLDTQTKKVSFRMTPTIADAISEVRVYISRTGSNRPVYRIGLQSSNPDGTPSGTWLGATQHAYNTFQPAATGWASVALQESVVVPASTNIHLVVEWASGTINASRSIELSASTPLNGIIPLNGTSHPASNTLFTTGASWSARSYEGIYVLRSATTTFGNPFSTTTAVRIFGTTQQGQRFTVGSQAMTVSSIGMYVARRANAPADDLDLLVRNIGTNGVIGQQVLVTRNQITPTFAWYTATFSPSLTLPANATIRLELSSPISITANSYLVSQSQTIVNGTYTSLTYQGTTAYAETRPGNVAWAGATNADLAFQLTTTSGSSGSGSYESSVIDTGIVDPRYSSIAWNATTPAGSTVTVQTRTGATLAELASQTWVGFDGTSATTYAPLDVIAIATGAGKRYIQYRAQMTSTGAAPTFNDLSLVYEP